MSELPPENANRCVAQTLDKNKYPICRHAKAGILTYTVDIMRYSVEIMPDKNNTEKYFMEFTYDAHVDGR